ncbi:hypothetical protein EVG20_g6657, partial [Dentipellis fragilis]
MLTPDLPRPTLRADLAHLVGGFRYSDRDQLAQALKNDPSKFLPVSIHKTAGARAANGFTLSFLLGHTSFVVKSKFNVHKNATPRATNNRVLPSQPGGFHLQVSAGGTLLLCSRLGLVVLRFVADAGPIVALVVKGAARMPSSPGSSKPRPVIRHANPNLPETPTSPENAASWDFSSSTHNPLKHKRSLSLMNPRPAPPLPSARPMSPSPARRPREGIQGAKDGLAKRAEGRHPHCWASGGFGRAGLCSDEESDLSDGSNAILNVRVFANASPVSPEAGPSRASPSPRPQVALSRAPQP